MRGTSYRAMLPRVIGPKTFRTASTVTCSHSRP